MFHCVIPEVKGIWYLRRMFSLRRQIRNTARCWKWKSRALFYYIAGHVYYQACLKKI